MKSQFLSHPHVGQWACHSPWLECWEQYSFPSPGGVPSPLQTLAVGYMGSQESGLRVGRKHTLGRGIARTTDFFVGVKSTELSSALAQFQAYSRGISQYSFSPLIISRPTAAS